MRSKSRFSPRIFEKSHAFSISSVSIDLPAGSSLFAGGLGAGSVFLVVLAAGAVAAIASSGGGNSTNGTN
ncbi:hypothetical protein A8B74_00490 [Sulfitobacter geojensis]|nr:hypothetical protein A8B74_00490 [Sulfitobacter geojensis]